MQIRGVLKVPQTKAQKQSELAKTRRQQLRVILVINNESNH